jgi:hypothetical protein
LRLVTIELNADTALGKELTITRATGGGGSANSCYYLYDYLRKDFKNNPVKVKKLQVFLRDLEGFTNLQITGIYDDATIVAVNSFQNKYKADILTPWGHTAPTGYTYILTKKKVNEIYCKTAFPVTALQQQEIDAFRHFLESLRTAGIDLTQPKPQETVPAPVLQNDVIGLATTTATTTNNIGLTTLAGTSSTTQSRFANAALAFMAWPVTAWNLLWNNNWCGVNGCNYCSWLNLILIIIIIIILYFWYREWNNNRKLEDINKEIDLQ